jgi:hypothetical protein
MRVSRDLRHCTTAHSIDRVDAYQQEEERLRGILKEFSNPSNWDSTPPGSGRYWRGLGIPADIAREALEGK